MWNAGRTSSYDEWLARLGRGGDPVGMRRVDAENLQRIRPGNEFQLVERELEAALRRMPLDIGIELRGREAAADHIALKLGHVDAVGGETAERLVKRGGNVAHLEHEGSDDFPGIARRPLCLARQHD